MPAAAGFANAASPAVTSSVNAVPGADDPAFVPYPFDPERAKAGPFGAPIAHGVLVVAGEERARGPAAAHEAAERAVLLADLEHLAQLRALNAWGQKPPADLSLIKQPVLVVKGDNDRMVPTLNTHDLARRLPNSQLIIYPDAGHGGVFQFHAEFVMKALGFLAVP